MSIQLQYYDTVTHGYTGFLTVNSGILTTNGSGVPSFSALGTGVADFLTTPSSANLATAVTGETGSGALVFGTSPTISGATLTGATTLTDSGSLTAAGELGLGGSPTSRLHLRGTYTSANAFIAEIGGTHASSVTTAQRALVIDPTFAPSGASLTTMNGLLVQPTINSTAFTITNYQSVASTFILGASFSGTITTATHFLANDPTVSGGSIGTLIGFSCGAFTNGNGLAAGTVTNNGIFVSAHTAGSAGGTVNNRGIQFNVPSGGSSSGTTNNRGIFITGNGGTAAGGTVNNFAIYSDSTALSQLLSTRIGAGTANATNATAPFFYITTSAGTPTGVPRDAANGATAIQYDTTNLKLWVYDNVAGAWKGVVVA